MAAGEKKPAAGWMPITMITGVFSCLSCRAAMVCQEATCLKNQTPKWPKYSWVRISGIAPYWSLWLFTSPKTTKAWLMMALGHDILTGFKDHIETRELYHLSWLRRNPDCSMSHKKCTTCVASRMPAWKIDFREAESCFGWSSSKPACFSYFFPASLLSRLLAAFAI